MREPQNECCGLNVHHHSSSIWREQWSLFLENTNIHQIVHTISGVSQRFPKHTDSSSRNAWTSGLWASPLNTHPWGAVIVWGQKLPLFSLWSAEKPGDSIYANIAFGLNLTWSQFLQECQLHSFSFLHFMLFFQLSTHSSDPHLVFRSHWSFLSLCFSPFLKNYLLSSYNLHLTSLVFSVQIYQALTAGRNVNCFIYFKLWNLHNNLIGKVVFALL